MKVLTEDKKTAVDIINVTLVRERAQKKEKGVFRTLVDPQVITDVETVCCPAVPFS